MPLSLPSAIEALRSAAELNMGVDADLLISREMAKGSFANHWDKRLLLCSVLPMHPKP